MWITARWDVFLLFRKFTLQLKQETNCFQAHLHLVLRAKGQFIFHVPVCLQDIPPVLPGLELRLWRNPTNSQLSNTKQAFTGWALSAIFVIESIIWIFPISWVCNSEFLFHLHLNPKAGTAMSKDRPEKGHRPRNWRILILSTCLHQCSKISQSSAPS